jgi:Retroviral aspartyl protease
MRFPGQKRADGVYTPHLEVDFRFPGDNRTYLALVDSGADWTMIPAEFLPPSVVYADLPNPSIGRGVGGEFEIRMCPVEVWFQKWKVNNWCIVIQPGKMPDPGALLGRQDFMRRFSVSFDWSAEPGMFDVRPNKR